VAKAASDAAIAGLRGSSSFVVTFLPLDCHFQEREMFEIAAFTRNLADIADAVVTAEEREVQPWIQPLCT